MKKCKGCGVSLQNDDPIKTGYVTSLNQDYCQRCFRLTHYGDTKSLDLEIINNDETFKIYDNYKKEIYILIVDAFDALCLDKDNLLEIFKDRKVLLVINKIDLLPRSVKDDKLEDSFKEVLRKCNTDNIIGCLLTYKNDYSFNDLFFEVLKEYKQKKFVFAGRVNAGKTTLINKLLGNNDLTVSTYPGTTISSNEICFENYTFIDTPGLIDENSFINNLDKSLLKDLIPNKCVKPKVFQFYENQSYFIEGLIELDLLPKRNSSITFYIKNELNVHRTKLNNAENYLDKHSNEFKLKLLPFKSTNINNVKDTTFYLKGLGYIRVKGLCDVRIKVNKDIKVYGCGVKI